MLFAVLGFRHFTGQLRQAEAVTITNHGRDSLVLLSAEEYRCLAPCVTVEVAHDVQSAQPPPKRPRWPLRHRAATPAIAKKSRT